MSIAFMVLLRGAVPVVRAGDMPERLRLADVLEQARQRNPEIRKEPSVGKELSSGRDGGSRRHPQE